MRILRLISGLVTLALMATLASTALTTTTATAAPARVVAKIAAVDTAAKAVPARPRHQVKNIRDRRVGPAAFRILGKTPTFLNKRVIVKVDRCNGRNCNFRQRYTSDRTTRRGAFKFVVRGVGRCFELTVPGTRRYRVAKVFIGCIS